MTTTVFSAASYLCALFSMLVVLGVPCVLGTLVCRRHKGAGHAIVIGIFCFIIGAYLLEQIFHSLVFGLFGEALRANPLLYAVYGGLAAGVFEETARLLGLRSLCKKAGVPCQNFSNRADIAGGSTLGNISSAHVSIPAADIGLAQLAMHSAFETAGALDTGYLIALCREYYT